MKVQIFFMMVFFITMISAADMLGDDQFFVLNEKKAALMANSSSQLDSTQNVMMQKKSVFKAAVLSAVVPGAGEYYGGSLWKAAIFAGLEITLWTVDIIYDHKGDEQDKKTRKYGDENWDERVYWSKVYYLTEGNWEGPDLDSDNDYMIDDNYYTAEYIDQLRVMEGNQALSEKGFTHRLPRKKTQQYYEMIYKYPEQFGWAWKGADFNRDVYSAKSGDLPATLIHFRGMWNKTEDFYAVASTAVNAVILNHVVSMIDAALTTRSYNRSLQIHASIKNSYYLDERVQMFCLNFCW